MATAEMLAMRRLPAGEPHPPPTAPPIDPTSAPLATAKAAGNSAENTTSTPTQTVRLVLARCNSRRVASTGTGARGDGTAQNTPGVVSRPSAGARPETAGSILSCISVARALSARPRRSSMCSSFISSRKVRPEDCMRCPVTLR